MATVGQLSQAGQFTKARQTFESGSFAAALQRCFASRRYLECGREARHERSPRHCRALDSLLPARSPSLLWNRHLQKRKHLHLLTLCLALLQRRNGNFKKRQLQRRAKKRMLLELQPLRHVPLRGNMDFDTITDVSIWAIFGISLMIPAWLVFAPPRIVRSWPTIFRPVLAVLCTHAAIYALFYCGIYPTVRAYNRARFSDGVGILDGILLVHPGSCWRFAAIVAPVLLVVRFCFLAFRHRHRHDDPSPTTGNA
jgi:hypothetical protein